MSEPVFVFGSNLAGRHGKGAALWARQHRGAIYGQGIGRQGNSYAIPTKGRNLKSLTLAEIRLHVRDFLDYALLNPDVQFQLTPIGCGLAGYRPEQIAPMFDGAPPNVIMPPEFALSRWTVTGPYLYPGDLYPSFRIDAPDRIVASVYIADGDENRAREEAVAIVAALATPLNKEEGAET